MRCGLDFLGVVGNRAAKRALLLLAVDPGLGGVLLIGPRGCAKSTLARAARGLAARGAPWVELPLNATEERVLGGVDLTAAVREGVPRLAPGLLAAAHGGTLLVDDFPLLCPEVAALVLSAHERGTVAVCREGLDLEQAARFSLVATAGLDDGSMASSVLDRFGLAAQVVPVEGTGPRLRVLEAAAGNGGRRAERRGRLLTRLAASVAAARDRLPEVRVPDALLEAAVARAATAGCAGHRGERYLVRAARAYAAFVGAPEVGTCHLDAVAPLVLLHRARPAAPPPEVSEPPPPPEEDREDEGDADDEAPQNQPQEGDGDPAEGAPGTVKPAGAKRCSPPELRFG